MALFARQQQMRLVQLRSGRRDWPRQRWGRERQKLAGSSGEQNGSQLAAHVVF